MSFAEYGQRSHAVPYVLRWETRNGSLIYFGSAHTFDPSNPQVAAIEGLWSETRPTVAFYEGGDPPTAATLADAVGRHGEAGLVRMLAAHDHVPALSLEPSHEQQVAGLRLDFTAEQIKLYYVARRMAQYRRDEHSTSEVQYVEQLLSSLSSVRGLEGPPHTYADVQTSCERLLLAGASCVRPPEDWFDPANFKTGAYTNELGRRLSRLRDEHMVERLRAAVMVPGARVFAVVGASHVVMQEDALRRALSARPARLSSSTSVP